MKRHIKSIGIAAIAIIVLVLPLLKLKAYVMHIALMAGIHVMLALGLNIITGYCGQLSIGHAAFFGIGAYTSALLTLNLGISFWLAILIASVLSAVFGILLGLPTLRLKGPYLVIATLGFGEIVRLILVNWVSMTRGPMGLPGIRPPEPIAIAGTVLVNFSSKRAYYYLVLAFIVLIVILMRKLANSKTGRSFIAIREDQIAAEVMGVNLGYYKLLAFSLSALIAGFAGGLYAHYVRFISPDTFISGESINLLTMIVVGGMGTIIGPIIGAVGITYLLEQMRVFAQYRMIFYGIILFLSSVYMPKGIMGLWELVVSKYNLGAAKKSGEGTAEGLNGIGKGGDYQ